MKARKTVLTLVIVSALNIFMSATSVVLADQNCEPTGPYGICTPDTDITIGQLHLSNATLMVIAVIYAVGIAILLSGLLVKNNINKQN